MEKNLRYTGSGGTPLLDTVNKMERLYKVPLTYFEGLADEVMAKIRLGAISGNIGYKVPEGYFSGLAGQIMDRIHAEKKTSSSQGNAFRDPSVYQELKDISPLLLQIGNQNVYEVPKGYFQELPAVGVIQEKADRALPNTRNDEGGKVIPLTPRKKIWRTAVAAAAIVVVIFSGQRYFTDHHDPNVPPATDNQFASKINTSNDSFRAGISELSDEEIMGYLSTPDASLLDSMSEAAEETQKAISSMTNEELENYLERTPATY